MEFFITKHALEAYQIHFPQADKEELLTDINSKDSVELSKEMAFEFTGRRLSEKHKGIKDKYILSSTRQGIFVVDPKTYSVITYLRFQPSQQNIAESLYPTNQGESFQMTVVKVNGKYDYAVTEILRKEFNSVRGGVSDDPSYLYDEVKDKLTDGYKVGCFGHLFWIGNIELDCSGDLQFPHILEKLDITLKLLFVQGNGFWFFDENGESWFIPQGKKWRKKFKSLLIQKGILVDEKIKSNKKPGPL